MWAAVSLTHTVFQSFVHTVQKAMPFCMLQAHEHSIGRIIQDYAEVFDAFFEQRHLIPAENFCEVAFGQLEQDPLGMLGRIHETLGLPYFDYVDPRIHDYTQSLDGYSKNSFPELSHDLRERLAHEWSRCFEEWQHTT